MSADLGEAGQQEMATSQLERELELALQDAERRAKPSRFEWAWEKAKGAKWWLLALTVALLLLVQPFPTITGYRADLLKVEQGLSMLVGIEQSLSEALLAAEYASAIAERSDFEKERLLLACRLPDQGRLPCIIDAVRLPDASDMVRGDTAPDKNSSTTGTSSPATSHGIKELGNTSEPPNIAEDKPPSDAPAGPKTEDVNSDLTTEKDQSDPQAQRDDALKQTELRVSTRAKSLGRGLDLIETSKRLLLVLSKFTETLAAIPTSSDIRTLSLYLSSLQNAARLIEKESINARNQIEGFEQTPDRKPIKGSLERLDPDVLANLRSPYKDFPDLYDVTSVPIFGNIASIPRVYSHTGS
jgi:hypothetical protein